MLKNEKIRLRSFNLNDAKYIAEMRNDLEGTQAAGGNIFPSNQASETEWIANMYPNRIRDSIHFVIEEIETEKFIGYCSALKINYIDRNAHVGFYFHKKGRGKGYFRDAQIVFYHYLFNEINLRKLYSYALSYNTIAINLDLKIGFKQDGVMKEHVYQKGKYQDVVLLSLTKKDFSIVNKKI